LELDMAAPAMVSLSVELGLASADPVLVSA